ncbi:MAG: glycosyl hydrolase, partial [Phaeodactylibacter sp.]|nr:glycosyl hydrolase [Phaeodactylibacter sp.]
MRLPFFFLLLFTLNILTAQNPVPPTSADSRLEGYQQRLALRKNSIANTIPFRTVGPTVMSGRVTDIEVWEKDPTHFYVAYASGGLWKTENNGLSFTPLFDREAVMTIGDIAVDWETGTIWVGTGEVNSSRSSYAGTGIYKSTDKGETWSHMGLPETHHIGRIIIHPEDPNTVWVAALGHLYSSNPERGLYKTTNGGKTWERTLYVGPETGVVDLVIDPINP